MILLTRTQRAQLFANGRQGDVDHIPVVKFYNPLGAGVWLATELDEDGDIMFGLADIGYPELGSWGFGELEAIRLPFGIGIERDVLFTGMFPISVWAETARMAGSIRAAEQILSARFRSDAAQALISTDTESLKAYFRALRFCAALFEVEGGASRRDVVKVRHRAGCPSGATTMTRHMRKLAINPQPCQFSAQEQAVVYEARQILLRHLNQNPVLSTWQAVLDYCALTIRGDVERFHVLYLDGKNRLISDECLAIGTVNHAPVYPREVLRRGLALNASALIIVHNHPTTPSMIALDHAEYR